MVYVKGQYIFREKPVNFQFETEYFSSKDRIFLPQFREFIKTSFNCTEEKFEAVLLRKALISDSSIKILRCDWPVMAYESVSEQNWTSVQLNLV